VISNHLDLSSRVQLYDIPFYHLLIIKETEIEQEPACSTSPRRMT
jgi:formyltetrahydrofolate hydrolase